MVEVSNGAAIAVVSVEDLIADRMAQFSSTSSFQLAPRMDEDYLDRRIQTETSGAYDLGFLRSKIEERQR